MDKFFFIMENCLFIHFGSGLELMSMDFYYF